MIAIVATLVILVLSLRAIARFFTDYLWFQSLGLSTVWSSVLVTKVGLALIFSLGFFAIAYGNLTLADRLDAQVEDPDDELLARYREFVGPRRRSFRIGVCALLALVAGAGSSGQWSNFLLFRHGRSFGRSDPLLGKDIGFYAFKLPFLSYCVSWAFASLTIVLLATAVTHYLGGGVRPNAPKTRVLPGARAHLSILLAIAALLKAVDYWLSQYQLTLSDRGVVNGATYTDVHAQLPATKLLIAISLFSAALLVVGVRRRSLSLPIVAVASWLLVAIVAGEMYPWFVQRFEVKPKESAREAEYINRNIQATRYAIGLDHVAEKNFDYVDQPGDAALTENADTVRNIRLLDPNVVQPAFQSLEAELNYYTFRDLDADRYKIDGQSTEVILGVRELDPNKIPQDTWEARHLIYTHGYGLALAPANAVATNGAPNFLVGGVPITAGSPAALRIDRPEVYFGEGIDSSTQDGYAVVGTTRKEQTASGGETTYAGTGGVDATGFVRRAAFGLRFGDLDLLISDYLTPDSKVLFNRDVADRVRSIAPFLQLDNDPYPVVADGRITWVLDAYTTSASYPYGQTADTSQLDETSDLRKTPFNYIRNSVKATVDAYDGSVKLYLTDELYGAPDPIARAYAASFDGLFQPLSAMPPVIREHLRYPEDMFRIQTQMWGRYHVQDPGEFYTRSDNWDIAQDPGTQVDPKAAAGIKRSQPYFQIMKVPEAEKQNFLLFRPFVPFSEDGSKKELTAFMVGLSDGDDYGKLQVFTMTQQLADGKRDRNRSVVGPLIVDSNMKSSINGATSQTLSLLNSGGSQVEFGNMLIIPIEQGLVYVRPYFVRSVQGDSAPELRNVIVATGNKVQVGRTLAEALKALFPTADVSTLESGATGTTIPGSTPTTSPTNSAVPATAVAKIQRALELFAEANKALTDGGAEGLGSYQSKTAEAQQLVREAGGLLGAPDDTSTTTVPPTTPGTG